MSHGLYRTAFLAEWPNIRRMGFRKFAIAYGLRGFALPASLAVWVITWVVVPVLLVPATPPDASFLSTRRFWLATLSSLILWPIGGWILAKWEWTRNERRFGKAQR